MDHKEATDEKKMEANQKVWLSLFERVHRIIESPNFLFDYDHYMTFGRRHWYYADDWHREREEAGNFWSHRPKNKYMKKMIDKHLYAKFKPEIKKASHITNGGLDKKTWERVKDEVEKVRKVLDVVSFYAVNKLFRLKPERFDPMWFARIVNAKAVDVFDEVGDGGCLLFDIEIDHNLKITKDEYVFDEPLEPEDVYKLLNTYFTANDLILFIVELDDSKFDPKLEGNLTYLHVENGMGCFDELKALKSKP